VKKKPAKATTSTGAKSSAGRPPQSEAAKERVRRHLAGLSPLSLDTAEAAGAPFISPQDRARARYAQMKQEKEAQADAARRRSKKADPAAK
jgi:hypothetical protein